MLPAVGLLSNISQMTTKCGKNKEVVREPQASPSLMFLSHFDVFCDPLLNKPTATWNLFVLYNDQIHIPALNRLTVRGLALVQAFFKSQTLLFVSAFSLFFLYISRTQFPRKFFNVFSYSTQNNGENILQKSKSLLAMTHDANCCEDFLRLRRSKVVKNSFCLRFSIFLFLNSSNLTFSRGFHLLNPK